LVTLSSKALLFFRHSGLTVHLKGIDVQSPSLITAVEPILSSLV
jgi:hypothetical protein